MFFMRIRHKTCVCPSSLPNGKTFSAFFNSTGENFTLEGDMLRSGDETFDLNGMSSDLHKNQLVRIHAYQEFWHSWKTFHPETRTYPEIQPN